MISEVDITRFDILSDTLREDQINWIASLQNKRPRIGKVFPTQIALNKDLGVKGTKVVSEEDSIFYITSDSFIELPNLWESNDWRTMQYQFSYSSDPFPVVTWDAFCEHLCHDVYDYCTQKPSHLKNPTSDNPKLDFLQKLCKPFYCRNGVQRVAISDKGICACRFTPDIIVEGEHTVSILKQIDYLKSRTDFFCQNCIALNYCNMKCGLIKEKNFEVCEAKQVLYSYIHQLNMNIFNYYHTPYCGD